MDIQHYVDDVDDVDYTAKEYYYVNYDYDHCVYYDFADDCDEYEYYYSHDYVY